MRIFMRFLENVLRAGVLAIVPLQASAQIPIEHLAKTPSFTSMSLSADGEYLAGLVTLDGEGDLSLAIWDTDDLSKPPIVTQANDRMKFISVSALKAGKVFVVGQQAWTGSAGGLKCLEGMGAGGSVKTYLTKAYITDRAAKQFDEPFTRRSLRVNDDALERCFELSGEAGIALDLSLSQTDVMVRRTDTSKLISEYYRVNLETGRENLIYRETASESASLWDPRTGTLLAKSKLRSKGNLDYDFENWLRNDATGKFERHEALTVSAKNRRQVEIAGRDEKTGQFYILTNQFSDKVALYFYDPKARKFAAEPLFAHPNYDVVGVELDTRPATFNALLAVAYSGATTEYFVLDPEWRAIRDGISAAFPGRNMRVISATDDLSKILFSVSDSTRPPAYFLLKDKQITLPIGEQRPWLESDRLRKTELITYTARDGMKIPGFLTLPLGWRPDDGPLPSIVLPHGGPWARDTGDWDPAGWTQFLASRGYAVLQPQYRGSAGWGHELWTAGDAQWGLKMQDDKDDGAAWLVSQGIADADRMAIFGYSYGGFAAMAATVRENGPFKCAIAGAGVSNLTRLGMSWSNNRIQRAVQGRTVKGMDPMKQTKKANIPILVYHGDRDVRVPLYHGRDFYNAVKDEVPARLLVVKDMKHSLPWRPEHHRQTLAAIEGFLSETCAL
ncbi:MAG: prolyl oligopeptidase family serine peptidase [Pseudomonadota bacterium]